MIAVKILHELGHALVAKRCGCKVPTMGVAFLVMWPMAYTDVTESWKLGSHRKRLAIACAGIATELVVAAWALFLWGVLPDGSARSICFFLGTVSIVATLAINASPFMRFDGYFLLSDILGIPNLHGRAFAYARWLIREKLFGLGDPIPEPLDPSRQRFFLLFAMATWMYRLVVFTGIAILVYQFFFKLLGIFLFFVEIWYFILRPVVQEFKLWHQRWDEMKQTVRRQPAFYIGLFLFALLVIPFDVTVNTQGVLKPSRSFTVIASQPSQVISLPPLMGTAVEPGSALLRLDSPELNKQIRLAEARIEGLQRQVGGSSFDPKLLAQQPIFKEQLASALKALDGLRKEKERLNPLAPFKGVVVDVEPDLFVGEWLPKNAQLMTLIDDSAWIVEAYVEEADLKRLDVGNWGRFIPEGRGLNGVNLRILSIDTDASRVLTEGVLASTAGGEILVRQQDKKIVPERAIYRVKLQVLGHPELISTGYLRGRVTLLAWPKSILGDFLKGVFTTLMREVTF